MQEGYQPKTLGCTLSCEIVSIAGSGNGLRETSRQILELTVRRLLSGQLPDLTDAATPCCRPKVNALAATGRPAHVVHSTQRSV